MKRYRIFPGIVFVMLMSVIVSISCTDEPDDYIPPSQPIISENPDSVLGDLTVEVIYYHNGHYSVAPSGTKVRLYVSDYALEHDIPLFKFEVSGTDNTIYFGYLNPGDYYILAYTDIGLYDYEGIVSALVVQNQPTMSIVTMERIITE